MNYLSLCSGIEAASVAWEPLGWNPVGFSEIEKFPSEVLSYRFPLVNNYGDMLKYKEWKIDERIDLLVGGTPCFVAGTLVLTPSGYRPIEDLKIGDEVVDMDGNVDVVDAVGSKPARVGRLKIYGRPDIVCTPDHPFYSCGYARKGHFGRVEYGTPCFMDADKTVGKLIGRVVELNKEVSVPHFRGFFGDDAVEMAGWYVGDGYIRRWKNKSKKVVVFALVSEKKIERFRNRFCHIPMTVSKCGKVTVYNTAFAEWLSDNFGELSHRKRIPYWLQSSDRRGAFVEGYLATDGCIQPANGGGHKFLVSTVSPMLAYGLADMVCGSVRVTRVNPKCVIEGRTVNQRDYYTVSWSENRKNRHFIGGRWFTKSRSFTDEQSVRTVYNVTVRGSHTYVVQGIAVHNCQSFSVAGLRKGLADPRGNLMLAFGAIASHFRAKWIVWENVPGVLSSNGGRDFGSFLGMLEELGYGFAYRVLDAQFFGVPQRRRRVFVVGCLGNWLAPAAVLFDSESLSGNPPPSRSKGKGIAFNAQGSASQGLSAGGITPTLDKSKVPAICLMDQGGSVMGVEKDLSGTLRAQTHGNEPVVCFVQNVRNEVRLMGGDGKIAGALMADAGVKQTNYLCYGIPGNWIGRKPENGGNATTPMVDLSPCITGMDRPAVCYENHGQDSRIKECGEVSPTLNCNNALPIVMAHGQANAEIGEGLSPTLNCNHESPIIADSCQLRRFTPRECERLQGFPDDWTKIPWRNKPAEQCPDAPRYKACGNSMAVPVMRWIGERIGRIENKMGGPK